MKSQRGHSVLETSYKLGEPHIVTFSIMVTVTGIEGEGCKSLATVVRTSNEALAPLCQTTSGSGMTAKEAVREAYDQAISNMRRR